MEVQTKHTSFLFQAYAALKSSWPLKAGRMVSENTNGAGLADWPPSQDGKDSWKGGGGNKGKRMKVEL